MSWFSFAAVLGRRPTATAYRSAFSLSIILVAAAFISVPAVLAQGYFGTVSGLVTDQTGAVLPGAHVTLLDQEKGYKFEAATDQEGRYLFRSVAPGLYSVIAEIAGFETARRVNIRVNVTQNPTANLSLKVAGSSESVEVKAQSQRLEVQDATTGLVVNRNFINDLPLVDRYVMDLAMLTPGVTEADDQCGTGCTGTNFVSNGSRNSTADVLMDGVTVTNMEPNGGVTQVTYTPSSEAVEEFRVEQSNFSAEYGFSGASVVNMVTRSGTNNFHGGAYEFARNTITDANFWFNPNKQALPPVHRHNFGGTLGGPIWRNKTFFFFDFDGTRQSWAGSYKAGVPNDAERAGDFGVVCTAQGGSFDAKGKCTEAAGQIWDPYSGVYGTYTNPNDGSQVNGAIRSTYIPYNNIANYASPGNPKLPASLEPKGGKGNLIDPVAQAMLQRMPEPNIANGTIYYNWITSGATHNPSDQFDVKIDHRFNQKNLLSARYSQEWNNTNSFNCFKSFVDPCAGGSNWGNAHLFSANDVQTFSPTLQLTATLGFTRGAMRIRAYSGYGGVGDPLAKLGFPAYLNSNGFTGVPSIFIDGSYYSAGYTSLGGDPYGNYKEGQDAGQLTVALDKVRGPHDVKVGFEGRQHQMNYIQTNAPNGDFSFDRPGSNGCPGEIVNCGGDAMASFLMGQMGSGSYEIQDQPATEDRQFAWYAQENWKTTKTLTLNIGLRYDVTVPRTDRHNRQNWFDPTAASPLIVPGMGALHGGEVFASSHERRIVDTDWRDVQPRFGFAYQLTPSTAIRGGYGMYYSQTRAGATGVAPYGAQGYNQWTGVLTTYQSDGATPYLHLNNPYPNGLLQPQGSKLGLMNDVGYGATGPLRSMTHTPYEQSWSFSVERQMPFNVFLTAIYAGKKGTHLYFSGINWVNHLGPSYDSYSSGDIANLTNYVNNPFAAVITDPNSSLSSPQVPQFMLEVPYPQFPGGVSTEAWPVADSSYHSTQLMAEKRYSNGMQFLVTYVWSKSIDDASAGDDNTTWQGSFTSVQDPNKPHLERSLSTFDIPSVLQASYIYELPFGRGKRFGNQMPGWLNAIAGGWKTNGVWRVANGRPLCFTTADGTSIPTYGTQRPNIAGTLHRSHGPKSLWLNQYLSNPQVLSLPDAYTLGNMRRAVAEVRTPRAFNANLSMEKLFSLKAIGEGMSLEMRLEAQNALNHPVFGTPDTSLDDSNFGQITTTSNAPRQVQLGAKINF